MTQHSPSNKNNSFYFLQIKLEMLGHQKRIRNIQERKNIFSMFDEDINALREKENIIINPLPEKTYYDSKGGVRVTVPVSDSQFQKHVCRALIHRGYCDTDDSTEDVRIMQRDRITMVVTSHPPRKTCASTCSAHCKKAGYEQ